MSERSYYEAESHWEVSRYLTTDETRRFDQVVAMIPDTAESLLDLGAGNGVFLRRVLDARQLRCAGLERAEIARQVAQRELGLDLVAGDIANIPYPDRSWDVVSSLQVLEHLPTPLFDRARSEMARVARRFVVVNVPFNEYRTFNRCPDCGTRFPDYYHVRRFTRDTMNTLIPGFALRRTEITSKVSRALISILFEVSWKAIHGSYSAVARCPLCGYTNSRAPQEAAPRTGARSFVVKLRESALLKWPRLPWYREVICLYERQT